VWPLISYRKLLWTFASPLGQENRTPSDILVDSDLNTGELIASAWRAGLKSSGADVIEIQRLRSDSLLCRFAMTNGRTTRSQKEATPYSTLRNVSNWDAYSRSRTGRSRNPPDYLQRRLASNGKVSVSVIDGRDAQAQGLVDWLISHKRQWAERGGIDSSWLYSAGTRRFLTGLVADTLGVQPFRFFVLTLNGTPIAVNLLSVRASCVDLVMNTYDAAYAKLSPGTALVDHCVKWAFESGRDFDFGSGDQSYKQYWSGGCAYETTSLQIATSNWGLLGCSLKHIASSLREDLGARLRKARGTSLNTATAD
jgi:CelD/BcsL family acetyltransferase involved in cellulose biosynthesis